MEDVIVAPAMEVVNLNVTDTEIARMKGEYMSLTINGIEDKAGFKKVYESRQIVKKTRTGVEKYAKELKEQALAWQRKVNAEKDRITGELSAIEDHLQAEEDRIAAEKERIAAEEEAREKARIQSRIDKLAAFGFAIDYTTITVIDDATFEKVLDNARIENEKELDAKAEQERLASEEAAKIIAEREELERLRAEKAEQDRIIREQQEEIAKQKAEAEKARQAEEARIKAEKEQAIEMLFRGRLAQLKNIRWDGQDARAEYGPDELIATYEELISLSDIVFNKVRDEHNADQVKFEEDCRLKAEALAKEAEEKRQAEIEVAKAKAVEEARNRAEKEAREAAEAKAEHVRQEKAEAERQAALRPDKEKLEQFAQSLGALITFQVQDEKAQAIINDILVMISKMQTYILKKVKEL